MEELEDLHADQTHIYFTTMKTEGEGLDPPSSTRPLPHPNTPINYWRFQGGTFIVVLFVKCSVGLTYTYKCFFFFLV